jgi:hypothetical protein
MLDRLQRRIEQKAEDAFTSAVDKTARTVNTILDTGSRIKALTDDPDESISIESMVLVFVDTVRDENAGRRPASREEIVPAYRGRQRLVKWISRLGPWGVAAGYLASLYSEAAILCDVADVAQTGLSREDLGAHVIVSWGVVPDIARAKAAMHGEEGMSVADYLKGRLPISDKSANPERMTKAEVVRLLWKLRALSKGKAKSGESAVEEMIATAEKQLGSVSSGRLGSPIYAKSASQSRGAGFARLRPGARD